MLNPELTPLENAAIEAMLADAPPALLEQARRARVTGRRFTGAGFFTDLLVPEDVPILEGIHDLGERVFAQIDGLAHGAGFVLFVRGGRIKCLEGFSFDEPWPSEVVTFRVTRSKGSRMTKYVLCP
jgi:hypothetical protein